MRVEEYLSDYVFYPYMLYRGGPDALTALAGFVEGAGPASPGAGYWFGFGVLLVTSTLINLAYLRAYDATKRDWFGFEALRAWEERLVARKHYALFRAPLRLLLFTYLSVWHSPLFATLFVRSSLHPYAMAGRDWRAFWAALLLANLGWAAVVSGAVTLAQLVFAHLPTGLLAFGR